MFAHQEDQAPFRHNDPAHVRHAASLLRAIAAEFQPVAFASSLGLEDMVLTDMILSAAIPIAIVTLDTRRLHADTHAMIGRVAARYGREIDVHAPQPAAVSGYVAAHGENAFYESLALRKECCRIRKVEPLGRALAGKQAWITGQRREQSTTRTELAEREFDPAFGMMKFNPLASWSEAQVRDYIRAHGVPYNPLHDRGYPSIGCEPCTRAVRAGEDPRAGRWWWEQSDSRECGLHVHEEPAA